jgi:VCBS repeat-containing protein
MRALARLTAAASVAALGTALLVAPATAKPIEKVHFHDTETTFFTCETNGLPIRQDDDVTGSFLLNQRGSSPFPYGRDSVRRTTTWTNLKNGGTFTDVLTVNTHDAKITDNGDGTITVDFYGAGGSRYYDNAGKLVLKDPGNIRFRVVLDYNGTPADVSDDVELSFEVARESTGRTDTIGRDFCNDVLIFSAA